MFNVVDVDYESTGLEFRKTFFRSYDLAACKNFIIRWKLHPSKLIQEQANKFFIFDMLGQLVTDVELD